MLFNPRMKALAYMIWCHAHPLGWNCSVVEVAEALGISPAMVGRVLQAERWQNRLRVSAGAIARDQWLNGTKARDDFAGFGLCGIEALEVGHG